MIKTIIQAFVAINSILLINSQPLTTDMFGSTMDLSSTIEGNSIGSRYIIDYFEVSSTSSVPIAYPINQCTLYSLTNKDKYAKYICNSNNIVFKLLFSQSNCADSSLNSTYRQEIIADSSLEQGDINTFNCDGGNDFFITIESCSTNSVGGNLLIVPNVCYFDSGSDVAYQVGCVDTTDDGQYDSVYLYKYNLDESDSVSSCSVTATGQTKISFDETNCTPLFSNFGGYGVESNSECPIAPDSGDGDDGGNEDSSIYINSFLSFIVVTIISFIM